MSLLYGKKWYTIGKTGSAGKERSDRKDRKMESLSTLCYMEKDGCYLMLHRVMKKNDVNQDKWIGVGGHFEEGESPEECLLREVYEETGYTLTSFKFRGLVTFVSGSGETEYMSLFTADAFTGTQAACDEGVLEWVPKDRVWELNLWEGDRIFFRLIEENRPFFSLKLVYNGQGGLVSAALDGKPMELFDIRNEDGAKTGIVRERGVAHRDGSLHATSHIWIVRERPSSAGRPEEGPESPEAKPAPDYEVLLQKRSMEKDSYPGCYDISSAGHVAAGGGYLETALRELSEELGIAADAADLEPVGICAAYEEEMFDGKPFRDAERAQIYVYRKPVDIEKLTLQEEELDGVAWIGYEECLRMIREKDPLYCIREEEFLMLGNYLGYCADPAFML